MMLMLVVGLAPDGLRSLLLPWLNWVADSPVIAIAAFLLGMRGLTLAAEILTPKQFYNYSDEFFDLAQPSFRTWFVPLLQAAVVLVASSLLPVAGSFQLSHSVQVGKPEVQELMGFQYTVTRYRNVLSAEAVTALFVAAVLALSLWLAMVAVSLLARRWFSRRAPDGYQLGELRKTCRSFRSLNLDNDDVKYRVREAVAGGVAFFFLWGEGGPLNMTLLAGFAAARLLTLPMVEYLSVRAFVRADRQRAATAPR
ncbi:MAG TPA: hypothetical protein PLU41_06640 [Acidobacteriota bacterium]|nr:hypothetical protein [Acidobacteriota bacterium]HNU01103.1 hypothetical protein [Acidobacteriota bacterium]HPB27620.1 hypothetical protein [Acidobacteriota bacterium]HQO25214.1 hypothetical protein [Acidobacteriota bacterium]HQP73685.1 hypothetical protein [Acidobacteriota bacterium]